MHRSLARLGQLVLDLFGESPKVAKPEERPLPGALERSIRRGGESCWGDRGGAVSTSLAALPVVFSARLRSSWRLEHPRTHPVLHLPRALERAPEEVWGALGEWVLAQLRPSPGSRARARLASRRVFEWMGQGVERIPAGSTKGRYHDLQVVYDRVNRTDFDGQIDATIRWSPRPGGLSTHREVPTASGPRHLITIGLVYDHPDVPSFALEGVVRHEMLHILHPPRKTGPLKRHVHHRGFRDAEQAFPGYRAWRDWELREMPRLLRNMRRRKR